MWYDIVLVHISFLESVQHLVLDEADRLLDREFLPQVQEIVGACSSSGIQKAMFSATLPAEIEKLALKMLRNPIRVVVGMKYVLPVAWPKVLIQSLSH